MMISVPTFSVDPPDITLLTGKYFMKSTIYTFILFFVLTDCQMNSDKETPSESDAEKVEETLKSFFRSISDYDYQGIREITSADFVLIENGPVWDTEKFIGFIKQFEEDATISYEFSDMQMTIDGSTAWMVYKNKGVMNRGNEQRQFNWTESAVFKKVDDQWKIELLHSTMNEADSTQN